MSKRVDVLEAVKRLIQAALPDAVVIGMDTEEAKPTEVGPGGLAIVRAGDPGDPEIDLSPRLYWYEHSIPIELAAYGAADRGSQRVLDEQLGRIGQAIEANRTLGGLGIWLDASAPIEGEVDKAGAVPVGWADFVITASYSTTSPLG
jgi:hypothetical protein